MTSNFGSYLKQLRSDLGLSQSDLAQTLSSTQRHISFLETGRSQPTRSMLGRLATDLALNAAQRASLFEASGFHNPYKQRQFASQEVTDALDMVETRVLKNWPFPAFVLDSEWTILRTNSSAKVMLQSMGDNPNNMFDLILSADFRKQVVNWDEASAPFYYRLQSAAAKSTEVRKKFDQARANGLFDGITDQFNQGNDIPVYVPLILQLPNGVKLSATSLLGRIMSIQDALVEGYEIELMVPVDEESEAMLRMFGG